MLPQVLSPMPGLAALVATRPDPHAVVDAVLARLADRRGDAAWISVFTPAELHARAAEGETSVDLRDPSSFDRIADRRERSIALFLEAAKVIGSPRCLNCHPVGDSPTQRETMRAHRPPVVRGVDGHGAPAMHCATCHHATNDGASGVPGQAHWALAPASMAWQGRSSAEICAMLKTRAHNGGRSLAAIVEHMAHDELVGWAWVPGADRGPAPGTQARFGALVRDWVGSGAACPAMPPSKPR